MFISPPNEWCFLSTINWKLGDFTDTIKKFQSWFTNEIKTKLEFASDKKIVKKETKKENTYVKQSKMKYQSILK
jgi:hypothetical protein